MSEQKKPDYQDFTQFFDAEKVREQFQEMFAAMPFGTMDTSSLMAAQQKNLESMKKANEAVATGASSLMAKNAEMFQQAMSDGAAAMKKLGEAEPGEMARKNMEMLGEAMEKSMANYEEIAETIRNTWSEVSRELEGRMEDNMKEFNEAIEKAGKR